MRSLTDALGFELTAGQRPGLARLLLRTVLLSELIALPVALVMTSVDSGFAEKLGIATIYSQTIGLTCAAVSWVLYPRLVALDGAKRRVAITVEYFVCGAVGAEIARRLSPVIFGEPFNSGPAIVSWAIGASIALIVGLVTMTVRQLRARVVSTELEALQARINPHFLFNTLNSIAALIREDPHRAEAMTLQLSSLFRYTLQAPRMGLVTLEEESVIVAGYLAIEQERLGDRLRYRVDIDEALLPLRIPALALQPLVENAIKHGIATSVEGGVVAVRGWRDADMVHLTVEDTGTGEGDTSGTGEGLENVRQRLRATFGKHASVTLRRLDGRTEAHLRFPAGARA
jgi:signal transduction histidine kinase